MSETERHYAQIEKEALASTWACEKFSDYLLGLRFKIESDHKPLVPLLNTKCLNGLPPRILRFRLRLARFDYTVHHVPGKLLYIADTLSRAPITASQEQEGDDTEAFISIITIPALPASPDRLDVYRQAQREDPVCMQIIEYCNTTWPRRERTDPTLRPFWGPRISHDNLLLFNSRIVMPKRLQKETLNKIHVGHQGIERCLQRTLPAANQGFSLVARHNRSADTED